MKRGRPVKDAAENCSLFSNRTSRQLLTTRLSSFLGLCGGSWSALRATSACTLSSFARAFSVRATTSADSHAGTFDGLWLGRTCIAFGAPGAVAVPWSATTCTLLAATLADGLVGALHGLGFVLFARLEICQSSRLIVDISDLLITLNVELSDLLASRSAQGRFKVGGEASPGTRGLVAHAVLGVHGSSRVGRLVL